MEVSDIINIVLCLLSFALAAISVVTVIITLKQNNKMIENSTRPYIVVYSRVTNFQSPAYYLVVKNMGKTGAKINEFNCNIDLSKYSYTEGRTPFGHMRGTFLAPGQSMITNVDSIKLSEDNVNNIEFNIIYDSEVKSYKEQYNVNYKSDCDNIQARASTNGKEEKIISYTLQDLVEKLL